MRRVPEWNLKHGTKESLILRFLTQSNILLIATRAKTVRDCNQTEQQVSN